MTGNFDIEAIKKMATAGSRYEKQLSRLEAKNIQTSCIKQAVEGALKNLAKAKKSSLIIYGEPQSGKTEMMICLTAKLLDEKRRVIIHLLNDNVDLLTQNLKRFKTSGLAPNPRNSSEVLSDEIDLKKQEWVIFCKKNTTELKKLIGKLGNAKGVVVIDDEADFATPNSKVNKGTQTPINEAVSQLLGPDSAYIGVTATPARLNLNNTFDNDADLWVQFPPHDKYTGQNDFFPLNKKPTSYTLTQLPVGMIQRKLLKLC